MQNLDELKALACFEAKSPLATQHPKQRKQQLLRMVQDVAGHNHSKTMAQMLNSVLALSSRTRRILQEPVSIELDVFKPDGRCAVVLNIRDKTRAIGQPDG